MDTKNNTIKKQIEQLEAELTNLTNSEEDKLIKIEIETWIDALQWVLTLTRND